MTEIRIGIIGFGKIARDQHVPSIAGQPGLRFAAAVAPHGAPGLAVPVFADFPSLLREIELDAVAICTPPGPRYAIAHACLAAGLHVLLEKPPCATVGEIADLAILAARQKRTLFTTWHSQFNDTVVRAAEVTRAEGIASLDIQWLEDVEKWHPGQQWIWQPGGFGVFDPGINALSIATTLCPRPLLVRSAELVMHEGGQQPIAATLAMATGSVETGITARFDWRHKGDEQWDIAVVTGHGTHLKLSQGGAVLSIDGGPEERSHGGEYPAIYRRFAALVGTGQSDVDVEPLRAVADALLVARRHRPG
ncbi:MAG TPA: Gfo/Idh/MocA family oxidoreductase [Sphingomonas sp.]|nr:Gfo/Idh/MocA family oxidoreductase [Sphingomonas sp.]